MRVPLGFAFGIWDLNTVGMFCSDKQHSYRNSAALRNAKLHASEGKNRLFQLRSDKRGWNPVAAWGWAYRKQKRESYWYFLWQWENLVGKTWPRLRETRNNLYKPKGSRESLFSFSFVLQANDARFRSMSSAELRVPKRAGADENKREKNQCFFLFTLKKLLGKRCSR